MAKGIEKELTAVTKVTRDKDEGDQPYFARLAGAISKLKDPDWDRLSEPAQLWANSAQIAVEKKAAIPNFDGEVPDDKDAKATKATAKDKEVKAPAAKKGAKADKTEKAAKPAKAEAKTKEAEKKAPAKKEAKAAPAKKGAKAAANGEGRGRKGSWPMTAKIKVVAKENPHRSGTKNFKRFEKYKNGMTVEQAIAAGAEWANMRYLTNLGHLEIS